MLRKRLLAAGLALTFVLPARVFAARPLLDYHRLDAYFELYASDYSVPWKPATVRLDTYTSAPVTFSVYQADVADVISAGANTRPRAIETKHRKPLAQWTYTPPGGYRFQSNDVSVPVGSREGFFVVEARRGNVGEQVWLNRTRVGLLSKETPRGIFVYGADLGTGDPLAGMRISFIAGKRFVERQTGRDGVVRWNGSPRPVFALAQWGGSNAFLSFLPQAPLPHAIVAVNTDSAVVHAGDALHAVGFVRVRAGGRLKAASGSATIALHSLRGMTIAQENVRLDSAGAFSVSLRVPQSSDSGEYTVLATASGATSATGIHVDANANGLSLNAAPSCEAYCAADRDVPLVVTARRANLPAPDEPVSVSVIRSPHAYFDEQAPDSLWGISPWFTARGTTGADGRVTFAIPRAEDGLASTYGVRVTSRGATADTRVVVPASSHVVRLQLERTVIGAGTPATFDVTVSSFAGGAPVDGANVRVQLIHGSSVQQQDLTTDDRGHARGRFNAPEAGTNLIVASAANDTAMDAAQLQVETQTMQISGTSAQTIAIATDRPRYVLGEQATVRATLSGATGSALLTIDSPGAVDARVVPVNGGSASSSFRLSDATGAMAIGAAFVHDGALLWNSVPLVLDAPGRPIAPSLVFDRRAYGPGALITAHLTGVRGGTGTVVVRLTKGEPSGSAVFLNAPDLLAVGSATTQDTAVDGASFHPWVDSTGEHPATQAFALHGASPPDVTMTQSQTQDAFWTVDRHSGDTVQLQAPLIPGRYVLSLLKIDEDGRVLAASGDVLVQ